MHVSFDFNSVNVRPGPALARNALVWNGILLLIGTSAYCQPVFEGSSRLEGVVSPNRRIYPDRLSSLLPGLSAPLGPGIPILVVTGGNLPLGTVGFLPSSILVCDAVSSKITDG
jgi:hypothetical protein